MAELKVGQVIQVQDFYGRIEAQSIDYGRKQITIECSMVEPAVALKPFDLEKAKEGAPLITRDGRKARFVAHVPEANAANRLIVYIEGMFHAQSCFANGRHNPTEHDSEYDVFIAVKKRAAYVNIYTDNHGYRVWQDYDNLHLAQLNAPTTKGWEYLAIGLPVEIEE